MSLSLLPAPAFTEPKDCICHLTSQSLSTPAGLSLCKWTGIFEQLQTHFWHSSCSMGATPFKGCQIKWLLHFISKPMRYYFCTYLLLRKGLTDSCNLCVPAELLLPAAGVPEHTDSALSGRPHVTGKYRTASSSGTPCMQHEHVLTSCPSFLFHPSEIFTPHGSLHYCIQHKEGLALHTHPIPCLCPGTPTECPRGVHVPAVPCALVDSKAGMKVILLSTKCLGGASGAPPCAGPGWQECQAGSLEHHTALDTAPAVGCSHQLELIKLDVHRCAKALLPASVLQTEGPYSLLMD